MNAIHAIIGKLVEGQNLSRDEMQAAMMTIMTGEATDAQIGGFLIALRLKGETVDEITGAAEVMRTLASPVELDVPNLVDTCGTGGDGSSLFNVSTASAVVAAAAGASVAKHGNRSVSSKSGSADVLEAAGVNLELTPDQIATCVREQGVGFMFALAHHGAMKYAIGPRRDLATRTVFNLLGPLTNPAGACNQVLGVFSRDWVRPLAEVLQRLGSRHVMVVHSEDGLDEISLAGKTWIAELDQGEISEYEICPEQFGIQPRTLSSMIVDTAEDSLALIRQAFTDSTCAAADMVALNAGAAIYVSGEATNLGTGIGMAQDAIGSGAAQTRFDEFVAFTRLLGALSSSSA